MRERWLIGLVWLAACVRQPVHVTGAELRAHAGALAAGERAEVAAAEGGSVSLDPSTAVTVELGGDEHVSGDLCGGGKQRLARWALSRARVGLAPCRSHRDPIEVRNLSVQELVTACDAAGGGSGCLLDRARDREWEVGGRLRASPGKIARGLGAVMLAGLATYCVAECDNPPATFGMVALTAGYLALASPLSLLSTR